MLRILRTSDRPVPDTELARRTTERLYGDGGEARPATYDRVRIEQHHTHLPKLADHGLVEWDRDRGEVRPAPGLGRAVTVHESVSAARRGRSGSGEGTR